jgi:myosin-1
MKNVIFDFNWNKLFTLMSLFLALEYPGFLLGINKENLKIKLTSHKLEARGEKIEAFFNVQKAEYTRDALVKALYSRVFDYLVDVSKFSLKIIIF